MSITYEQLPLSPPKCQIQWGNRRLYVQVTKLEALCWAVIESQNSKAWAVRMETNSLSATHVGH